MPNIFQATRFALTAIILLCTTLLATSCAKGKQSSQQSLYGQIQAVQGKHYEVLVSQYIGTSPLYLDCATEIGRQGNGDHSTNLFKTTCSTEKKTFVYDALIPIESEGAMYYLPIQVRSYVPIQLSDYPQVRLTDDPGADIYSKVTVTANKEVSSFASYRGNGDYVFIVDHVETDEERNTHFRSETISNPEGGNRP